jgi:RHS repeat-associated protein
MYTGRRLDEDTGLYHYRARAYDPETGRFLQRDTLEYVDGPNTHAYTSDSPVGRNDPQGLKEIPLPANGKDPETAYSNWSNRRDVQAVTEEINNWYRRESKSSEDYYTGGVYGWTDVDFPASSVSGPYITRSEEVFIDTWFTRIRRFRRESCGGGRRSMRQWHAVAEAIVNWPESIDPNVYLPSPTHYDQWDGTQKSMWNTFIAALRAHEQGHAKRMSDDWRDNGHEFTDGADSQTVYGVAWADDQDTAEQSALDQAQQAADLLLSRARDWVLGRENGRRHYKKGQAPSDAARTSDEGKPGNGLHMVLPWPSNTGTKKK